MPGEFKGQRTKTASYPIIAVPIGDPAGIGPEVACKAVLDPEVLSVCYPVLVGDSRIVEQAFKGWTARFPNRIETLSEIQLQKGLAYLLPVDNVNLGTFQPGIIHEDMGKASLAYLRLAVRLALEGMVDGIASAPANKESMRLGGNPFAGQTEFIASLCGMTMDPLTFLISGPFRVFQVSGHVSLRRALELATVERVFKTISAAHTVLTRDFGILQPVIGVGSLNPHAGDGGLLGDEEETRITPAIERAKRELIHAVGPIPGDALFLRAETEHFDGVVAIYHDQSNMIIKYLRKGVVTVNSGLPIVRTTVGHGTAFDISWQGRADAESMIQAILVAARLAMVRKGQIEG